MTYTTTFACRVGTTNPDKVIGLEIWLDSERIFNTECVTATQTVRHEFAEDAEAHSLRFVVKNKASDATEIDEQGKIVSDVCVRIDQLSFDDISVDQVFVDHAVYQHSNTQAKFYGELGCNGTVRLDFTMPIYLWLLEHM